MIQVKDAMRKELLTEVSALATIFEVPQAIAQAQRGKQSSGCEEVIREANELGRVCKS